VLQVAEPQDALVVAVLCVPAPDALVVRGAEQQRVRAQAVGLVAQDAKQVHARLVDETPVLPDEEPVPVEIAAVPVA